MCGVNINTNLLKKSKIRNRPVNTGWPQVSYASNEVTNVDTRWAGAQLDHPVYGGQKQGGLIHRSVVGLGADTFTL